MITRELVDKINFLARKQKTEGLTPEEKAEQKKVREEYLEGIRAQVRDQMEGLGIKKKDHQHGHNHHHHQHGKKCSCYKCDCEGH